MRKHLTYPDNSFNKIFFPLSLGSIPNPRLAIQEAERVLKPNGKIVIFEKLVDDGARISWGRRCIGLMTNCIFADINRNLSTMLGEDSPLKITQYESLSGRLSGCCTNRCLSDHYRVAVLTRKSEYVDRPAITAQPQ